MPKLVFNIIHDQKGNRSQSQWKSLECVCVATHATAQGKLFPCWWVLDVKWALFTFELFRFGTCAQREPSQLQYICSPTLNQDTQDSQDAPFVHPLNIGWCTKPFFDRLRILLSLPPSSNSFCWCLLTSLFLETEEEQECSLTTLHSGL